MEYAQPETREFFNDLMKDLANGQVWPMLNKESKREDQHVPETARNIKRRNKMVIVKRQAFLAAAQPVFQKLLRLQMTADRNSKRFISSLLRL